MAEMLDVAVALQLVLDHATRLSCESVSLDQSLDRILAESVSSDVDSPPHDKSMMDGYAVRTSDVPAINTTLAISQRIMAGMVPSGPLLAGTAAQIMTGAPIPAGSDAVIMVEKTSSAEPDRVTLHQVPRAGQNILRRATSLHQGQTVLATGERLTPARIGLCAEVGRTQLSVWRRPTVAILSTGDELVPCDQLPGPGQIRNSNSLLLQAAVQQAGGIPIMLGIARDEVQELTTKIQAGLTADLLILSGGVSAGVLDLVPQTLQSQGVLPIFHKLRMKPGKPLWFGVRAATTTANRTLVFGLPGNPVSSAVCYQLFVRPAIQQCSGHTIALPHDLRSARLMSNFTHTGDRPTYWPAKWISSQPEPTVQPLPWAGSADLCGYAQHECWVAFPAGDREYAAGELVPVLG